MKTKKEKHHLTLQNIPIQEAKALSLENIVSIFESLPGLYLILKPDAPRFTIIAVSDAYASATMTKKNEIIGKGLFTVFPDNPDDPKATGVKNLTSSLKYVIEQKKPHKMTIQKYDIKIYHKNDYRYETRYWSPLNTPVLDKNGNVQYIIHSVVDVTQLQLSKSKVKSIKKIASEQQLLYNELFKTQEHLAESENRFRALADNIPNLCWMAKSDGYIYWYNKRWYEYTGKSPVEMKGWGWRSVHDPKILPSVIKRWKKSLQTGKSFEMIFPLKGSDGVFRPFLTRVMPVTNSEGAIIHWFGTNTDITDQKSAEDKLSESEKRFRTLIENSADAVALVDKNGKFTYLSSSVKRVLGYNPEDLLGEKATILFPKDKFDETNKKFAKVASTPGLTENVEHLAVTKDGSVRWIESTITNLLNTPPIYSFVSNFRDITERKNAEERQTLLESISSKLITSYDNYVTLQDLAKIITSSMADYCRIAIIGDDNKVKEIVVTHNDPTKTTLAKNLYDNYKNLPESTHGIAKIIKTGKAELIEKIDSKVLKSIKKNPKLIKIIKDIKLKSYMGAPLIARGKVIGALTFSSASNHRYYSKKDLEFAKELAHRIALALDNARLYKETQAELRERKQAERNMKYLAEASKILSSSLDYKKTLSNIAKAAVPKIADWCSIDIFDKNNNLEQVAIAHKNPQKITWAKKLRSTYPPDINSPTGLPNVIRTGKSEYYPEITDKMLIKTARDKKHLKLLRDIGFTSAMIVPLFQDSRCVGGISFITTETKRHFTKSDLAMAEEIANRATLALDNAGLYKVSQDAVTLRDNFIAVASHELKTPITSVKIFTEILKNHAEKIGDKSSYSHLAKMDRQLDKLTDLIYNMLNISMIQTGRLEFNQKLFDLDNSIKEIIDVLQQGSPNHRLILEGATNKKIYGDEFRIGQVVSNLISNAIKYSPKSNKVIIELSSSPKEVTVGIKDFGIGLAQEHGKHIFERFYRVFDKTDRTFPGLGIGLYISREIIKRHHGELWVKSEIGKGSNFYFRLPLVDQKRLN